MKNVLSCVAVFLFATANAFSQQDAAAKIAQAMTDSLGYLKLDNQQKTQAQSLNSTAAASILQIGLKAKADTSFKGKPLAQQVMAVMKKRNDELMKNLTPEQQKNFADHSVQRLADIQTKMMTIQLVLNDEQIPQVYQANLKFAQQLVEGTNELKDSKRKMQKARAAKSLKSDAAKKDEELKAILNAEQYQKYESNKEAMQAAMKEKMQDNKNAN